MASLTQKEILKLSCLELTERQRVERLMKEGQGFSEALRAIRAEGRERRRAASPLPNRCQSALATATGMSDHRPV